VLPTLVYELEYPRSEDINWYYVAEKTAAVFGVLAVMNLISQAFIYPVVSPKFSKYYSRRSRVCSNVQQLLGRSIPENTLKR
jgi:hypothetical protein